MSPSDMPDFDNMSPEEMMRWMESLAKRQGVNPEELMTSADSVVAEIDESTAVITGPGYVPYGQENKPKAAEPAKPTPPAAKPTPPAPTPVPPPVVVAPPAPVAVEEPAVIDYENMSMDEIMMFMETLAKRQGANPDEFLTSANANVAEVDASTAQVNGPGYVPFGQENKPAAKPASEPAKPAPEPAKPAARPLPTLPPIPAQPAPVMPDILAELSQRPAAAPESSSNLDWLTGLTGKSNSPDNAFAVLDDLTAGLDDLDALSAELGGMFDGGAGNQGGALSWLDQLTSTPPAPAAAPAPQPTAEIDSATMDYENMSMDEIMMFMESLARRQGVKEEELLTSANMNIKTPPSTPAPEAYQAYNVDHDVKPSSAENFLAGLANQTDEEPMLDAADPSNWLGQLASNAPDDNYAAAADPSSWLSDTPEEPILDAADPRAWLGQLADDAPAPVPQPVKFDPNPRPVETKRASTGDPIADMLNAGITPDRESMEAWLGMKMNQLLDSEPLPLPGEEENILPADFDPDAPATLDDRPDWLRDMLPPSEAMAAPAPSAAKAPAMPDFLNMTEDSPPENIFASNGPALSNKIIEPPDVDMPDWLKADLPGMGESLADIFDTAPEIKQVPPQPKSTELDPELVARLRPRPGEMDADPWVAALAQSEAFEDATPAWYTERLNEMSHTADPAVSSKLAAANLPPRESLPAGVPESGLPGWFGAAASAANMAAALPSDMPAWLVESIPGDSPAPVAEAALPDWLSDAENQGIAAEEIPGWLVETLPEESQAAVIVAPVPAPVPTPAPLPTPAPVPARTAISPVPTTVKIDVPAALSAARSKQSSGDVFGALDEYEKVIRANTQLEVVTSAVEAIIKQDKENAAAHRVLGDALMRQGKLQAALDTYRKALNLL
jgi:hypothetical protein